MLHQLQKMVMTNAKQWEKRKHACRLCGQYIQNEEEHYLVIVNLKLLKENNFIVHAHEWDSFKEGVESDEELAKKLSETKQKRASNKTPIDEKRVDAFKKIASRQGFRIVRETANRIYFKPSRDVAQFIFDKKFGTFDYQGRTSAGLGGMFDRMYLQEFTSRLLEDIAKEMGQEPAEGFRVTKAVEQAVKQVESLLK